MNGKTQTPKQKYDLEIKEINKTFVDNAPTTGLPPELEEELEEEIEAVEEAMNQKIDKSLGKIKESATSVTREEHLDAKLEKQRQQVLNNFMGVNHRVTLKPEEEKTMTKVLAGVNGGAITDPVLKHLVEKKLDLAIEQQALSTEIKEVQHEVIEKMSGLTTKTMANKSSTDTYNRDILLYIQKNPKLLAE